MFSSAVTRLGLAGAIGVTMLVLAGPAAQAAATDSAPWAQSDAGAAHSRSNNTEKAISPATVGNVALRRTITAPTAVSQAECPFFGAAHPVVTGQRVYGVFGSRVSAYQAQTGALLWRGPADPAHLTDYTSVSVSGSRVVAGSEGCDSVSDPPGQLTVLNANTGAKLWQSFTTHGVFDTVVSGNTIVTYEYGDAFFLNTEAFDLTSGARLWGREVEGCAEGKALVVGGLALTTGCDENTGANPALVASNLRTGKTAWTKAGTWNLQAGDTDAASAAHLYVTNSGGAVVDLKPSTGATQHTLTGATGVLAVAGTRVFTTCSAGVCAYTESTGALSWQHAGSTSLAATADGVLYLADGTVLNAYNGSTIRQLFTGSATELIEGDGRIAAVTSQAPRALKLYGLNGS